MRAFCGYIINSQGSTSVESDVQVKALQRVCDKTIGMTEQTRLCICPTKLRFGKQSWLGLRRSALVTTALLRFNLNRLTATDLPETTNVGKWTH